MYVYMCVRLPETSSSSSAWVRRISDTNRLWIKPIGKQGNPKFSATPNPFVVLYICQNSCDGVGI